MSYIYTRRFVGFILGLIGTFLLISNSASAAFVKTKIADDTIFGNYNTMTAAQIDAFLNSFPGSCLSTNNGFSSPDVVGYNPSQGYLYGANVSAGTVIAHAAQAYELNPQVILSTLQKEQSLVSGSAGCHYDTPPNLDPCPEKPYGTVNPCVSACQYSGGCVYIAMGYDCPYYCAPRSVGFSKQVIKATWSLKFSQQRSLGNYGWNIQKPGWDNSDDPETPYNGPMTEGTLKRCGSCTATYFDGYTTIEGESVHMDSGATVALYRYTPFFSGNQHFVSIFEGWFGSTTYLDASTIRNNVPVTIIAAPYSTPAIGQQIDYTISIKNNFSFDLNISAIGIVGRAGSIGAGTNRDFGWQGATTLAPGASQQFTFSTTVLDSGSIYVWPAFLYKGDYVQYNNWGSTITGHAPKLTLSQPLIRSVTTVYAGQDVTFSATLRNDEPYAISYDAIGIPVKFYDRYNYDAAWVGPGIIQPGAEIALNGTRNIDKPGPFTYWVSKYFGGTYSTIGSVSNFDSKAVTPNFSVSGLTLTSNTPVYGDSLGASFTITNNLPVGIDVDAVGVVGRFGTYTGPNRDIDWKGPVHFNAGETKSFTGYSRTITDVGTHYYWIGIYDNGQYIQYNPWGSTIKTLAPDFSVSGLSLTSTNPAVGDSLGASFTITNNLPVGIDVDAVGVVGRFGTYTGPNRDIDWKGPVHFNAGETKSFTGYSRTITDVGTHYYWIGIYDNGQYIQYNPWGSTIVSHQ